MSGAVARDGAKDIGGAGDGGGEVEGARSCVGGGEVDGVGKGEEGGSGTRGIDLGEGEQKLLQMTETKLNAESCFGKVIT